MLAIELSFPGGRYHATPWDAHVNEGAVEWPPSPWRILRALIATRHLKAAERVSQEELEALVEALATELPRYCLPANTVSFHTRHYMPIVESATATTTKVFDTFVHIPGGSSLVVAWPGVTLDVRLTDSLSCLVERLGYLGRAEAWVEATISDGSSLAFDCQPASPRAAGGREAQREERELVRLLAPLPAAELAAWRESALRERTEQMLEEKRERARSKRRPEQRVTLSVRERASLDAALPRSVCEALVLPTEVMRRAGWSRPPGSRWVEYTRPWPEVEAPVHPLRRPRRLPTVARYALAGEVLPRLTDTLVEAEKIRTALVAYSEGAPVFRGRDPVTDAPLSGHRHAFILPEANGRHGHITHVTIFARMGFDERAREALERLNSVRQRGGHDLQLVLLGVGFREDFGGTRSDRGQSPLLAASEAWVSRTPFAPTRHPKRLRTGEPKLDEHGLIIGSAEHDLVRLLLDQGFPRPRGMERIPDTELGGKPTRWLAFHTQRKRDHGLRASVPSAGFRITFPVPVRGPLTVGYGAHLGLGCFVPLL